VSGTSLSLKDIQKVMASEVSKPEKVEVFHQLEMFNTWLKLELFVKHYIPFSIFWHLFLGQ